MKKVVRLSALLLGLFASSQLFAQASHLGVPVKQLVTIQATIDTTVSPPSQTWAEFLFGVKTQRNRASFIVPAGKTLVMLDFDVTVINSQPTTTSVVPPIFNIVILDPSGNAIHYPARIQTTLKVTGREELIVNLNAGVAVPAGYQVTVESAQIGTYSLTRAAINGYYAQ